VGLLPCRLAKRTHRVILTVEGTHERQRGVHTKHEGDDWFTFSCGEPVALTADYLHGTGGRNMAQQLDKITASE